jgi:hypothetical protein
MAKAQFTDEDNELLAELGVEVGSKVTSSHTPREERIIAGFEEIECFVEEHRRLPQHGEDKDIFERIYAVRLDKIQSSSECQEVLAVFDKNGLLTNTPNLAEEMPDDLDDDALLAELGVTQQSDSDITHLKHVRPRAEIRAAEEVAQRTVCKTFEEFRPLFEQVQHELKTEVRKTRRFKEVASVNQGEFFILAGQLAYIAEVGEPFVPPNGKLDARMRVIYDNGTEYNILKRSFQRALYKDEAGRRITDPYAGPLFADEKSDDDIESGTIYVLRSKSEHPVIKQHCSLLHKIGVTGGSVEKRIANAKLDPTFLMADIEVIATYELYNINRTKLENLLHRFFEPAKLEIEITDRFGNPISPREWFLVPLFIIDEVVERVKDESLSNYRYDANEVKLIKV